MSEVPRMTPEEAIERLRQGNARFCEGRCDHPHADAARRRETTEKGQHPFATVLTCSDSRVPPELLFDQGIGDLFVVRVAGNVCNNDEIASIEYGTAHLDTPVCVILGHSRCGAVTAVVDGSEVEGPIATLVAGIQRIVAGIRERSPELDRDRLLEEAILLNTRQAMADLLEVSAPTRDRVRAGTLKVVGAHYDIESGVVDWLDERAE